MKLNLYFLVFCYLIFSNILFAEDSREEKIQNYINAYKGDYDIQQISKDASTYGVSMSEVQQAIDTAKQNSSKPAGTPPPPTDQDKALSKNTLETKVDSVPNTSAAAMNELQKTWTHESEIIGDTKALDEKLKNKTVALSSEQIAHLEKLKLRWNSHDLNISDHAKKLMKESYILESKQIASMNPDQFSAWKTYQETVPNQAYINSNGSWVPNPHYDPCYEIRINTSGANTPENMKECSKLGSRTGSSSKQLANNLDYIKLQENSAIEMLITGAEHLKMGKISKDQFLEISKYVAEVARYSAKVKGNLSSNP